MITNSTTDKCGELQIALSGTFEIASYGDQLFPEIYRRVMGDLMPGMSVRLFSTTQGADVFDGSRIASFSEMENTAEVLSGFVIGGGDILRFDRPPGLGDSFPWASPFTPLFVVPALAAAASGVPFVWNAPALPLPLDGVQADIIKGVCELTDYISVRDEISQKRLAEIGCAAEVVPDSAFLLAEVIPLSEIAQRLPGLLARFGIKQPYVAGHISPVGTDLSDEGAAGQALSAVATGLSAKVLLLPLSPVHGDIEACARVADRNPFLMTAVRENLSPLDIAALIAGASAFIGSAFHGNLTAFAYSVPSVAVNPRRVAKLQRFAELTGRASVDSWQEAGECLLSRLQNEGGFHGESDCRHRLAGEVRRHFQKMAAVLLGGRRAPTSLSGQIFSAITSLIKQQTLAVAADRKVHPEEKQSPSRSARRWIKKLMRMRSTKAS